MRTNTIKALISEHLNAGKTRMQTYEALRPMVDQQLKPMVFTSNVGGGRIPKPLSEQLRMLRYRINHLAGELGRMDDEDFELDDEKETREDFQEETRVEEEKEEKPVKASGKSKRDDAKRFFLSEVRRLRAFCKQRELAGETIDSLESNRAAEAGARLIPAGIPPEALLHSLTLHWGEDARRDANVPVFDVESLSRKIMAERGIEKITRSDGTVEIAHVIFGYVLTLFENRQLTYLVGPSGSGKSHLAKQVADYLDLNYAETPISIGCQRGDLLGRHTAEGFVPAEFPEVYAGGGVFNFEEFDAGDSRVMLVLNNALAGNKLYNSVNGESYARSLSFVGCATANTFGLGATREFSGREKQDAAILDRWRMGRTVVNFDERIEASILGL